MFKTEGINFLICTCNLYSVILFFIIVFTSCFEMLQNDTDMYTCILLWLTFMVLLRYVYITKTNISELTLLSYIYRQVENCFYQFLNKYHHCQYRMDNLYQHHHQQNHTSLSSAPLATKL